MSLIRPRRSLILLSVVLLILALAAWPGPAQAGGPTSVLLTSTHGRAAALYHTDKRYDELAGQFSDKPSRNAPEAVSTFGSYVTMTWLIHDVSIWRIERIFLDATGGPWLARIDLTGSAREAMMWPGESGSGSTWLRPRDPAKLRTLLAELGLLGSPAPAAAAAPSPSVAAPADSDVGTGWWWALPGILVGALLVLAGARLRRPRPVTAKPTELVDQVY